MNQSNAGGSFRAEAPDGLPRWAKLRFVAGSRAFLPAMVLGAFLCCTACAPSLVHDHQRGDVRDQIASPQPSSDYVLAADATHKAPEPGNSGSVDNIHPDLRQYLPEYGKGC